jgi:outer membrane protein assembly factor BamB
MGIAMAPTAIFIGIRGDVIALDRATGHELWKTGLKGAEFVNLLVDADRVIATTKGEVFCLSAATGDVLWNNRLPGQGTGLATIATASGASSALPGFQEKKRQDDEAAGTAVIAAT